jgi:hypothetical protein
MPIEFVAGETRELNAQLYPIIEEYICPVCGQPFPDSESLESHFLNTHTSSVVHKLFKISTWIGSWRTTWENGQQVLVPTYAFEQVSKVGITAYYYCTGGQMVEQRVTYPDGSVRVGYTSGWQGPRHGADGDYCFTYSLPGFRPTRPGVYYGRIAIRASKNPVTDEWLYSDEVNLILVKLV